MQQLRKLAGWLCIVSLILTVFSYVIGIDLFWLNFPTTLYCIANVAMVIYGASSAAVFAGMISQEDKVLTKLTATNKAALVSWGVLVFLAVIAFAIFSSAGLPIILPTALIQYVTYAGMLVLWPVIIIFDLLYKTYYCQTVKVMEG